MNYYPRYLGDYQRKTSHLSLIQHGVYAVLMDHYYALCKPLPADNEQLYRICRAISVAEQRAVDTVVQEFFPVSPDGLRRNSRCDEEIAKWEVKAETNRVVGKTGGRPKKKPTENPDGNHDGSRGGASDNPHETQSVSDTPLKSGVLETHGKPSPAPESRIQNSEARSQHQNQRESAERAHDPHESPPAPSTKGNGEPEPQRGVRHFGTALCEIGSQAVADSAEAWREERGINPAAVEAWLQHCEKLEPPKVVKPHERLLLAKLLATHGDDAAQMHLVRTCSANGWRNVRITDARSPSNGARGGGERIEQTIARLNREADEAGEPTL